MFIPRTASANDPLWNPAFRTLALELAKNRARPSFVEWACGLPRREARELYRVVNGETPPRGAPFGRRLDTYLKPAQRVSREDVACAQLFLHLYIKIEKCFDTPPHLAYLILQAYAAYREITRGFSGAISDINELAGVIWASSPHAPPSQRVFIIKECRDCGSVHFATHDDDMVPCPVCAARRPRRTPSAINVGFTIAQGKKAS